MANMTSQQAFTLSQSVPFVGRLSILLDAEAMVVLREVQTTPNHTVRAALAAVILNNPYPYAATYARELVFDTNLIGAGFTTDAGGNPVDSNATDAAIRSQISTNWNVYCAIPQ